MWSGDHVVAGGRDGITALPVAWASCTIAPPQVANNIAVGVGVT